MLLNVKHFRMKNVRRGPKVNFVSRSKKLCNKVSLTWLGDGYFCMGRLIRTCKGDETKLRSIEDICTLATHYY